MAVSPQLPAKNLESREKNRLEFPILSDQGNAWARQLGLTFSLPEDLQQVYQGFGINLPEDHGTDAWELPLPTRIVVDRAGIIRRIDADPDYTRRPEVETSLEVLRGL